MLTLARCADPILPSELEANEFKMRWLTNMAHVALSRLLFPELAGRPSSPLTPREVEILQWTADGKTAGEISEILQLSDHTVTFHMGNAMRKQLLTKTAAVVKAAVLGCCSRPLRCPRDHRQHRPLRFKDWIAVFHLLVPLRTRPRATAGHPSGH
jgi:LuxR family transcriptional regulator